MAKFLSSLGSVGRKTHEVLIEISRAWRLVTETCYGAFWGPLTGKKGLKREHLAKQLFFMGNESVFIVALVSASVGAVLALQAAYQLKDFGAVMYTGALVSVSMARELGPVITAVVIAGRVGASITAELGTMKVQEEVDALTTMGIPPIPFLVVPRVLAMLVMLPCLTILSFAVGILGGYLISTLTLGIGSGIYLDESFKALVTKDLLSGLAKSFVFAFLISFISIYTGLGVHGGAEAVGRATTQSVVVSIIAVIIADGILTAIFYYVFP